MAFAGDVKDCARKVIGHAVMPAEIWPHIVARLVVVDAEVVQAIAELFCSFHGLDSLEAAWSVFSFRLADGRH
jgi:hypothetical protein